MLHFNVVRSVTVVARLMTTLSMELLMTEFVRMPAEGTANRGVVALRSTQFMTWVSPP